MMKFYPSWIIITTLLLFQIITKSRSVQDGCNDHNLQSLIKDWLTTVDELELSSSKPVKTSLNFIQECASNSQCRATKRNELLHEIASIFPHLNDSGSVAGANLHQCLKTKNETTKISEKRSPHNHDVKSHNPYPSDPHYTEETDIQPILNSYYNSPQQQEQQVQNGSTIPSVEDPVPKVIETPLYTYGESADIKSRISVFYHSNSPRHVTTIRSDSTQEYFSSVRFPENNVIYGSPGLGDILSDIPSFPVAQHTETFLNDENLLQISVPNDNMRPNLDIPLIDNILGQTANLSPFPQTSLNYENLLTPEASYSPRSSGTFTIPDLPYSSAKIIETPLVGNTIGQAPTAPSEPFLNFEQLLRTQNSIVPTSSPSGGGPGLIDPLEQLKFSDITKQYGGKDYYCSDPIGGTSTQSPPSISITQTCAFGICNTISVTDTLKQNNGGDRVIITTPCIGDGCSSSIREPGSFFPTPTTFTCIGLECLLGTDPPIPTIPLPCRGTECILRTRPTMTYPTSCYGLECVPSGTGTLSVIVPAPTREPPVYITITSTVTNYLLRVVTSCVGTQIQPIITVTEINPAPSTVLCIGNDCQPVVITDLPTLPPVVPPEIIRDTCAYPSPPLVPCVGALCPPEIITDSCIGENCPLDLKGTMIIDTNVQLPPSVEPCVGESCFPELIGTSAPFIGESYLAPVIVTDVYPSTSMYPCIGTQCQLGDQSIGDDPLPVAGPQLVGTGLYPDPPRYINPLATQGELQLYPTGVYGLYQPAPRFRSTDVNPLGQAGPLVLGTALYHNVPHFRSTDIDPLAVQAGLQQTACVGVNCQQNFRAVGNYYPLGIAGPQDLNTAIYPGVSPPYYLPTTNPAVSSGVYRVLNVFIPQYSNNLNYGVCYPHICIDSCCYLQREHDFYKVAPNV